MVSDEYFKGRCCPAGQWCSAPGRKCTVASRLIRVLTMTIQTVAITTKTVVKAFIAAIEEKNVAVVSILSYCRAVCG